MSLLRQELRGHEPRPWAHPVMRTLAIAPPPRMRSSLPWTRSSLPGASPRELPGTSPRELPSCARRGRAPPPYVPRSPVPWPWSRRNTAPPPCRGPDRRAVAPISRSLAAVPCCCSATALGVVSLGPGEPPVSHQHLPGSRRPAAAAPRTEKSFILKEKSRISVKSFRIMDGCRRISGLGRGGRRRPPEAAGSPADSSPGPPAAPAPAFPEAALHACGPAGGTHAWLARDALPGQAGIYRGIGVASTVQSLASGCLNAARRESRARRPGY